MLRRRLQQFSCIINSTSFTLCLSLLLAHVLLRRYLPNVARGKENFDFFWEGPQEGDDQHHPPFVISWRVVLGMVLSFLVSCASDVGGSASGGLHVVVFYVVVGFGLKAATGLSQAAIAGASLTALSAHLFRARPADPAHNYAAARAAAAAAAAAATAAARDDSRQRQQHGDLDNSSCAPNAGEAVAPEGSHAAEGLPPQQPLVDLDLVLLLTPGLLLGVAVGVVLNNLLPEWFITALLVLVLLHSCHRTALRGLLSWHEERQAELSLAAAVAIHSSPQPQLPRIAIGAGIGGGGGCSGSSSPRIAGGAGCPVGKGSSSSGSTPASSHGSGAAGCRAVQAAGDTEAAFRAAFGSDGTHDQVGTAAGEVAAGEAATAAGEAAAGAAGAASGSEAVVVSPSHLTDAATGAASTSVNATQLAEVPQQQAGAWMAAPAASAGDGGYSGAGSSSNSSASDSPRASRAAPTSPVYHSETTPVSPLVQRAVSAPAAAAAFAGRRQLVPPLRLLLLPRPPPTPPLLPATPPLLPPPQPAAAAGGGTAAAAWFAPPKPGARAGAAAAQQQWQQQQHQHQQHYTQYRVRLQRRHSWTHDISLQQFPWAKLLSLCVLCLGFIGLTVLNGLLPLCSWAYVTHLLLFIGVTVCITVTLIKVILVEPLVGADKVSSVRARIRAAIRSSSSRAGGGWWSPSKPARQQQPPADSQHQHQHRHQHQWQDADATQSSGSGSNEPALLARSVAACKRAASGIGRTVAAVPQSVAAAAAAVGPWWHVLTGFGRPGQLQRQQQQEHVIAGEAAARVGDVEAGGACPAGTHAGQPGGPAAAAAAGQQQLSLFTRMRMQQEQLQPGATAGAAAETAGGGQHKLSLYTRMRMQQDLRQPSLLAAAASAAAAAAATDSYFFSSSGGPGGYYYPTRSTQGDLAQPLLGGSNAGGGGGSTLHLWQAARQLCHRVLGRAVPRSAAAAAAAAGDVVMGGPGIEDGEQPWRYEQPFPVAAPEPAAPQAAMPLAQGSPLDGASTAQAAAVPLAVGTAATTGGRTGSSVSAGRKGNSSRALVAVAVAATAVSVAAGVVTAVTGVAGSALLMPILLDFRVHTQVASASTTVLVFLSSSAAVLSFILQGRLIGTYALLFCIGSVFGGCVGVSLVGALVRLTRRPSLVVLALAATLGVAGLSCGVAGVLALVEAVQEGEWLGFRAICTL